MWRGRGAAIDAAPADAKANDDHRQTDERGSNDLGATPQARVTPGILPSALRASLRLFPIAPGDWVGIDVSNCVNCSQKHP